MRLPLSLNIRGFTTGSRYMKSGGILESDTRISYRAQELRDFASRQTARTATTATAKKGTHTTVTKEVIFRGASAKTMWASRAAPFVVLRRSIEQVNAT